MNKYFLIGCLLIVEWFGYPIGIAVAFAQNDDSVSFPPVDGRPTVKLSPKKRVIERQTTIPTIPIDQIQQFLSRPQLVTEEEIENAGYIIANTEDSLLLTRGHQIYASNLDGEQVGNQYAIVRPGQTYYNPSKDEEEEDILAREAIYLGEAMLQVPGDPSVLNITSAAQAIRTGDRLLPPNERTFPEDFHPHSPEILEDAYVIAVKGDSSIISQYQIVIINKGLDDNIERGHVLAVKRSGRTIKEPFDETEQMTLPSQSIGSLLVFRVFDRISYALVMTSTVPIHLFDEVTVP